MKRLTGAALGALLAATSAIAALAAGTTPNASSPPQTAARNPTTNTSDMAQSNMSARHMRRVSRHDEMGDRITDALNLLGANDYTDIQSIEPQGGQIVAVATLNGRSVTVAVDPQTHQIVNRS
jgi:acetyl-CoA carboxylase alpha subunit